MSSNQSMSSAGALSPGLGWRSRESHLFVTLAAIIIANAVVAELVAVKLFQVRYLSWLGIDYPFTMTCGTLVWPLVFLTTDTLNEFYGRRAVRFLSWMTAVMIVWMFVITNISIFIPAWQFSAVDGPTFSKVFGQGVWIMVGSIAAFLISQLVDVVVFHSIRRRLAGRHIWARATGSTTVSQLVDSFVVIYIAFWMSGKNTLMECLNISLSSYATKLLLAIGLTPMIYLGHWVVAKWLGSAKAHQLAAEAAADS